MELTDLDKTENVFLGKSSVLVTDNEITQREDSFDHIVSFGDGGADSYADQYLSGEEDIELYNHAYEAVHHFLDSRWGKPELSYRGVDLFLCFRKAIFLFVYRILLRHETLKHVLFKFPSSSIQIQEGDPNSKTPRLWQLVEASSLGRDPRVRWNAKPYEFQEKPDNVKRSLMDLLWPATISKGNWSQARVLIYADVAKSGDLLNRLGERHSVLYSSDRAPRWFLKSFKEKFTFCQNAFQTEQKAKRNFQLEIFVENLKKSNIFSGFEIRGMRLEHLLTVHLVSLFRRQLNEILFQIDAVHQFFDQVTTLESVFLDEDTNPMKNAVCQAAKLRRIKTFVECHGSLGHQAGYLPLTADYIFAWGNAQRRKLIRWGCDPSRVLVSGCSRYRVYQNLDFLRTKIKVIKAFKLNPNQNLVVVGFTPLKDFGQVHKRKLRIIADRVFDTIQALPEVQFIWKIHPGDRNRNYYFDTLNRLSHLKNVRLVQQFDPLLLAKAADVMIVYRSTYAIDGFALGKKVICIYDGPCLMLEEFKEFGIFTEVHDLSQMENIFCSVLKNGTLSEKRWLEARKECLNEGGEDPAGIIADHLLNGGSHLVHLEKTSEHIQ